MDYSRNTDEIRGSLKEVEMFGLDVVLTKTNKKRHSSKEVKYYVNSFSVLDKSKRTKAGVRILVKKKIFRNVMNWEQAMKD